MKIFDNNFDDVLNDADKKYQSKKKEYGETWKDLHIDGLKLKFLSEFTEWKKAKQDSKEEYGEIIDMINVLLMVATRLKPTVANSQAKK